MKLLVVNTITSVYRAKDILQKNGIMAYIKRINADLRNDGCGYALQINQNEEKAIKILENAGIKIRNII
ncbi:MAG: putative Se/S carrier-like protein [Oscillospiraceae bacterium]